MPGVLKVAKPRIVPLLGVHTMGNAASFVDRARKVVNFAAVAAFSSQVAFFEISIDCGGKGCAADSTKQIERLQPATGETAQTGVSVLCSQAHSHPSGIISKVLFWCS